MITAGDKVTDRIFWWVNQWKFLACLPKLLTQLSYSNPTFSLVRSHLLAAIFSFRFRVGKVSAYHLQKKNISFVNQAEKDTSQNLMFLNRNYEIEMKISITALKKVKRFQIDDNYRQPGWTSDSQRPLHRTIGQPTCNQLVSIRREFNTTSRERDWEIKILTELVCVFHMISFTNS